MHQHAMGRKSLRRKRNISPPVFFFVFFFFQLHLQIPANPEPVVDEGEKTDRVGACFFANSPLGVRYVVTNGNRKWGVPIGKGSLPPRPVSVFLKWGFP